MKWNGSVVETVVIILNQCRSQFNISSGASLRLVVVFFRLINKATILLMLLCFSLLIYTIFAHMFHALNNEVSRMLFFRKNILFQSEKRSEKSIQLIRKSLTVLIIQVRCSS